MKFFLPLLIVMLAVTAACSQDDPVDRPPGPPPHGEQAGNDRPDREDRDFRGRGRGRHLQGRGHNLRGEELDEAIEILRELHPQLAERLEQARENHPDRIGPMIHREYPRLRQFLDLKRREPKLFELRIRDVKLERASRDLAHQIREAEQIDDAEQATVLRGQLSEVAAEHFDVRQAARAYEIEMLKRRIEKLEAALQEHHQQRDEMIERRISDLLAPGIPHSSGPPSDEPRP